MNIEDMIMNGASEEEIAEAIDQIRAKRTLKMEEERQARESQKKKDEEQTAKEALKAEARAHFINAVLAYSEAFDLLEEGESWTEEDLKEVEEYLIQIEGIIPMYAKMMKKKKEFGFGDLFGLI